MAILFSWHAITCDKSSFEDPFSFPDPDWTISFWLTVWSTCDNESFVVAFYRHSYQIILTKHLNTSFVSCPRLASYFHPFLSQVSLVKEDSCHSPVPNVTSALFASFIPERDSLYALQAEKLLGDYYNNYFRQEVTRKGVHEDWYP